MAIHGKNTYVEIDGPDGVPVNIQAHTRSADSSESVDTADSSNFGQNSKTYVQGMDDETFNIGGTFSKEFLQLLRKTKRAIQNGSLASCTVLFAPGGNKAGSVATRREALITSIAVSASTSDVVTLTASFQRTGDTTDGEMNGSGAFVPAV